MALDYETPNVELLKHYMKLKGMNQRQLSVAVWGKNTHRGVVQEWTAKPDPRCSTLVKVCRVLGISTDSLFQKSDNTKVVPSVSGNGNVVNSSNVTIELADLKAENKAQKTVIEEKNKRIEELQKDKAQLNKMLDAVLNLYQKTQEQR